MHHSAKCITCIISFNPPQNSRTQLLLLSSALDNRENWDNPEVKKLAQVYKASKSGQTQNLTCGIIKPGPHLQSHLGETADPSS